MLRFTPRAYWWAIPWACLSQVRLVEHNPFPLPGHAHLGKPRWIGTASSPNLGESTSGEVKGSRGKRLLKSVSISNNFTAVDPSVLKFLIHLHPAPHPSSHLLLILHATSRGLWGNPLSLLGKFTLPSVMERLKLNIWTWFCSDSKPVQWEKGSFLVFLGGWKHLVCNDGDQPPEQAVQIWLINGAPCLFPKGAPTWTMSSLLLSKNTLLATLLQNVMNHDHCHHLDLWKSSKDRGWGYVSSLVPQRNIF